jgi:hypothetical protein
MPKVPSYLVVNLSLDEMESLLIDWRWLIGDEKRAILVAASGGVFFTDVGGRVFWLETGGGKFTEVASSVIEFETALIQEANQMEWLLAPVIERLRNDGMQLTFGQCYGYRTLPVLGGAYDGENRFPVPAHKHIGFTGYVHNKIKDLPDGTKISLKWTD